MDRKTLEALKRVAAKPLGEVTPTEINLVSHAILNMEDEKQSLDVAAFNSSI